MRPDRKQFERDMDRELSSQELSQDEKQTLVATAELLMADKKPELPDETLLVRILEQVPTDEPLVTKKHVPRSLYRSRQDRGSSLASFPLSMKNISAHKSVVFASAGIFVLLLVITLHNSALSRKASLVAQEKTATKDLGEGVTGGQQKESGGTSSETTEVKGVVTQTNPNTQKQTGTSKGDTDAAIQGLLAAVSDESATLALLTDETLDSTSSDTNSLDQLYDETTF